MSHVSSSLPWYSIMQKYLRSPYSLYTTFKAYLLYLTESYIYLGRKTLLPIQVN